MGHGAFFVVSAVDARGAIGAVNAMYSDREIRVHDYLVEVNGVSGCNAMIMEMGTKGDYWVFHSFLRRVQSNRQIEVQSRVPWVGSMQVDLRTLGSMYRFLRHT